MTDEELEKLFDEYFELKKKVNRMKEIREVLSYELDQRDLDRYDHSKGYARIRMNYAFDVKRMRVDGIDMRTYKIPHITWVFFGKE